MNPAYSTGCRGCIVDRMRSDDLTKAQCRALRNKIGQQLGYLDRLKRRMVNKGFPPDDSLLVLVRQAENAMHELSVEVYYRAVDGAGRHPPK